MWLFFAVALAAEGLDPKLVAEVAATAELPVERVAELLAPVERDDTVLKRMSTPWEAKPWHAYRKLFLTEERISGGRAYLAQHAEAFAAAEARTGVPAEVVLAIIGVETSYGKNMGGDAVLTALYTLGFHHERRGTFFRSELGHYLRLCEEQGWQPDAHQGSYAGAMGLVRRIGSVAPVPRDDLLEATHPLGGVDEVVQRASERRLVPSSGVVA